MDLWPYTNMSGIIRLAEACTPSLSENVEADNVIAEMVRPYRIEQEICNSEDERVLRGLEVIEARQEQLAKEKGIEVVFETPEINVECDECFTDGVDGSFSQGVPDSGTYGSDSEGDPDEDPDSWNNYLLNEFKEIGVRSPRCANYLNGMARDHWTQAYCKAKMYNIMSSNIDEALNSAIAKIGELSIVTMVESIRTKLMQWFCIRRSKARKLATLPEPITANVNKLMLRYHKESVGLAVIVVSDWCYQVSTPEEKVYFVDLQKKECTCNQFQKLLIPCCHALATARRNGVYIPTLVGKIYQVTVFGAAYAELIYPVPNQCDEDVPVVVVETEFNPPTNHQVQDAEEKEEFLQLESKR